MFRLPFLLISALALMGPVDETVTVEVARRALRPSLVETCQRTCANIGKGDWKRVRLSLKQVAPLARSLDSRWDTQAASNLARAIEKEDAEAALGSLLSITYLDTRDLLTPIAGPQTLEAKQAKTWLLQGAQGLRYLAPLIRAPRAEKPGAVPEDRDLLYSKLEKRLVNAVRLIPPSTGFVRNTNWRRDIRGEVELFLKMFGAALPELHAKSYARVNGTEQRKSSDAAAKKGAGGGGR